MNANRAAINTFKVRLMIQFRVQLIIHLELYLNVHFKIYIKIHKKGAPENAFKGALQFALELHLFMHLSTYWASGQNDSIKAEIVGANYAALKDASKISFYGALTTT